MRGAGVDLRDRQHRGVADRDSPTDERLQRGHDLAGDRDRVDPVLRHRGMPAAPGDRRVQRIRRREHRAGPSDDQPRAHVGRDVERERRVGRGVAQQPVVDHEARAVMPFLARLEHEDDRAGQGLGPRAQCPRRADQHRGVRIMPARMHRAGVARREGQAGLLLHRQRVHVAAQQHGAAIVAHLSASAAQDRDEARRRRPLANLQRQSRKRRLRLLRRTGTVEPDLGVGVDRAAQLDQVGQFVRARGGPVGGPAVGGIEAIHGGLLRPLFAPIGRRLPVGTACALTGP